jgi:glutaredoxin
MSNTRVAALAALVACALWGAMAHAQVYRIIGPDGRVTFSDRPPPDPKAAAAPVAARSDRGGGGGSMAGLPAEVRQAAGRFPVTLYGGADCAPCLSARAFLLARGVPFSEKSIATEEDVQALQRLSGGTSLPFATIGGQHIRGFSDAEWSQYLDAAGYPKTSQLPPSYRNPDPTPLVVAQQRRPAAPATAARQEQAPVDAPAPSDPGPGNPAGIRF